MLFVEIALLYFVFSALLLELFSLLVWTAFFIHWTISIPPPHLSHHMPGRMVRKLCELKYHIYFTCSLDRDSVCKYINTMKFHKDLGPMELK